MLLKRKADMDDARPRSHGAWGGAFLRIPLGEVYIIMPQAYYPPLMSKHFMRAYTPSVPGRLRMNISLATYSDSYCLKMAPMN